jgi:rare lipoprotein A (peptidoglycan hydrolase)
MAYFRQLFIVVGIGGAILQLRQEYLSPSVVMPQAMVMPMLQAMEKAPKPQGPKAEQIGKVSWGGPAQDGTEGTSDESVDEYELNAADPTFSLCSEAVVASLEIGTLARGDD